MIIRDRDLDAKYNLPDRGLARVVRTTLFLLYILVILIQEYLFVLNIYLYEMDGFLSIVDMYLLATFYTECLLCVNAEIFLFVLKS